MRRFFYSIRRFIYARRCDIIRYIPSRKSIAGTNIRQKCSGSIGDAQRIKRVIILDKAKKKKNNSLCLDDNFVDSLSVHSIQNCHRQRRFRRQGGRCLRARKGTAHHGRTRNRQRRRKRRKNQHAVHIL